MIYDSIGQQISVGDYVIYAKSGYARVAKITSISSPQPARFQGWSNQEIGLMTCSETKAIRRDCKITVRPNHMTKAWCMVKMMPPPAAEEAIIETRLARG